jgi:hypothetical protein
MAKLKIEITKNGDLFDVELLLVKTYSVESLEVSTVRHNDLECEIRILMDQTKNLTAMP